MLVLAESDLTKIQHKLTVPQRHKENFNSSSVGSLRVSLQRCVRYHGTKQVHTPNRGLSKTAVMISVWTGKMESVHQHNLTSLKPTSGKQICFMPSFCGRNSHYPQVSFL